MGARSWLGTSGAEALGVAALCGAWWGCSALGNVLGKLLLSEFPHPGTVALAQLLAGAALSGPALALAGAPLVALPSRSVLRALLPLAVAKFLTTLCSQISIWKVPVSYAHTVKATTPLWTAALARVLLGERQPAGVAPALALVAAGVALASATELRWHAGGLAAALAASALLALQHLYSKRLLPGEARAGLAPLRLLQLQSALALALFAPAWALAEGAAPLGALSGRGWALLAGDAALAWAGAAAALGALRRVSALSYAVLSCGKRVAVVAGSLAALRNPAPPLNVAGMALALLAVLLYQRARLRAAPPRAAPLLPV